MLKWIAIVVLFFVALGAVGAYVAPKFKPKPPEWKTEKITRGDIHVTVTATGTVNPTQTVLIGSQVSGRVKDVLKTTNDLIKKDEVLATLETDLLESERRSAEVRLAQVRAALSALKVEHENIDIRALRQKAAKSSKQLNVQKAYDSLELAEKNVKRVTELFAVNAATQNDVDIRTLERNNAKRDRDLMEIELQQADVDDKQIEADRKQLKAKEEQAQADILQADAALARAKTNLSYCTIISPIDGVVLQHLIEPGQTIAASFQTPNMFKLATDLSLLGIDAQLDEADIGKIVAGQEVTFDVDAYRGETFTGKVALVRLQSESKGNLVTYPVLVAAKNVAKERRSSNVPPPPKNQSADWKLLPGMSANLRFVVDERKGCTLLPAAALRFIPPMGMAPAKRTAAVANSPTGDETGSKEPVTKDKKGGTHGSVFVVNILGMLDSVNVLVGESDGDNFELLEGEVKDGDSIVTGIK